MGNIAKNLLGEGVKLGVSSRGIGSLKEQDGCKMVADDFILATAADIVADPSAPDAFVNGIMEGKEWVWQNGAILESELERAKRHLDNAPSRKALEERKLSAFSHFLGSL